MKITSSFTLAFIFPLSVVLISCQMNQQGTMQEKSTVVKDSVQKMMTSLENDISSEGPIAWLKYFEDCPDFFMASDGQLVFMRSDSAKAFIKDKLVKQIREIKLQWNNIRIDSLTGQIASVGADWKEEQTDSSGAKHFEQGYFTGIAEKTTQGWQLRNAHWSVLPSGVAH